ncbi:hypothetical protein K1719_015244 [Acacia pycnantha]|nr:hypothetical protein K1719_015244 [Acacia pycnantha]
MPRCQWTWDLLVRAVALTSFRSSSPSSRLTAPPSLSVPGLPSLSVPDPPSQPSLSVPAPPSQPSLSVPAPPSQPSLSVPDLLLCLFAASLPNHLKEAALVSFPITFSFSNGRATTSHKCSWW